MTGSAAQTRIGNDLVIGGEYYRLGYFTTGDSPKKVANWFRHQWEEQSYPVTADGDFVSEGIVSAFDTRQGLVRSIVLRTHAGKTLGFSVLKDLWVRPEQSKPDPLPALENALFVNDLVTRDATQHRTGLVALPLATVRDARDAAWTRAGFTRRRDTRTDKTSRVLEYSKGGQQVLVTLLGLDDKTTAVDELWIGGVEVTLALLALALAAAPPPGSGLIAERTSVTDAKVGEWVTYRLDGSGRSQFWRIAAVAQETDAKGRPAVWLELDFGEHPAMKAPMAQLKVLVARGQGLTTDGVTRALVAFGADRPREVEAADLPRFLTSDTLSKATANPELTVKKGEPMRLVTLGGTVTATPVELRFRATVVKRFWLCDQVPLLRVARLELPAIGYSMEARDWGLDAKPQMALPDALASKIRIEQYEGDPVP